MNRLFLTRKVKFILAIALIWANLMLFQPASISADTRYGRLTGVNWFGFETGNYVAHGLWSRDYRSVLQQIKDLGFNCIRIPWSNEMIGKVPSSIQINEHGVDAYTKETGLNLDLSGLDSLEVLDKIIDYAGTIGLYIILDNHSRAADGYMNETLWYTSSYSESKWISDWRMMVERYKDKSNVIGADLNNEPHGNLGTGMKPPATWGYNAAGYGDTDWKAAAERCGKELLKINPNLLIIVEGVELAKDGANYWWGGNLKDVAQSPITGIPAGNLVYSPHEYGSGVHMQSWFSEANFPKNMAAIWDKYFYFIKKQNIAPLLFGEFGIKEEAAANPASIDYKWFTTLLSYVGKDCSWTFWCINPNSGDTGGILKDDWVSVNTAKYNLLKPYLAGTVSTPTPSGTPAVTSTPTGTPASTPTPTPTSVPDCSVLYDVQNDWGSGATVTVTITNKGPVAINGWTLAWTFPGDQAVTNLWNATSSQTGSSVTVKGSGYNGNIPANGGTVSFGFNLSYSGSNPKPEAFTLNGASCPVQ
jgi:endoglucanase